MERRLRSLKAFILVVIMVIELFGVDNLRVLAETINITVDTEITESSSEGSTGEYYVNNCTLTIAAKDADNNPIIVTEPIYGSGGTIVNYGKVSQIGIIYSGIIQNKEGATITSISNYDEETINEGTIVTYNAGGGTITNTGTITTLSVEPGTTIKLNGGTINNLTSTDTAYIVMGGNAAVKSISGKFNISGSGTMLVTDSLNLTGDYSALSCTIEVSDTTNITLGTGSQILVTYGEHTYLLTEATGATLSDLKGHTVSGELVDNTTMTCSKDFPASKYLAGQTATAKYIVKDGYYFPTDYTATKTGAGTLTVNRIDAKNIEIVYSFGEETGNVSVKLPAASIKGVQTAPSGLVGGVEEVSGVTDGMEYAASADAAVWTEVTGASDTNTIAMEKGTWYFRYKETDDKLASSATAVIVKGEGQAAVEIGDVNYGSSPTPKASTSTNTGQTATIEYKKATDDDTQYSTTAPTALGSYVVRATYAATAEYGVATATAEFKIKYLDAPAVPYTLEGTKGKNGYFKSKVTVKPAEGCTISTALDGTYSDTLTVTASQAATNIYLKNGDGEMTGAVSLEAINIDRSAPVLNVEDGNKFVAKQKKITVKDAKLSKVTINGTKQKVNGTAFTIELEESEEAYVIVAEDIAGNSVSATINILRDAQAAPTKLKGGVKKVSGVTTAMEYAASKTASKWTAVTALDTMTIKKGTWYFRYKETDVKRASAATAVKVKGAGSGTVVMSDVYYGGAISPKADSDTNTSGAITIEYKKAIEEDTAYSTELPTEVGAYTVRATFAATADYSEATATADFKIKYLKAPATAYSLDGTKGNNGYFVSDVIVKPAKGYLIATELDGEYQESLTIKESLAASTIYLKKTATGEKTDAISLEAIKIKNNVPYINVEDGKIYYADTRELVVKDSCLNQVYINGVAQNPTGNEFIITLNSQNKKTCYEIIAEDDAGNRNSVVIYVAVNWMEKGVVPTGGSVSLESGNGYKLGPGKWTVKGDATTYSGNTTFYVRQDGFYTFENQ